MTDSLRALIRDVPDFPTPGIVFKDVTPLLADPDGLAAAVEALAEPLRGRGITKVLAVEARGFILGAPVALALAAGLVPVRKAGKLPWTVESEEYVLEYGTDRLEIHADAVAPGEQVVIVDDVLATGGTAAAAVRLARMLGAEVAACAFLLELSSLAGRQQLADVEVVSVLPYD